MTHTRAILLDLLHLVVLVGFAVAQPLYDLLGQNPEFFVAHKAGPAQILSLIFVASLGVALGLIVVELLARVIGESVRRRVHWVLMFGLAVLLALPILKRWVGGSDELIGGLALLLGLAFVILYARWEPMRLFMTLLSPAVIAFPLWFLVWSPVKRLILPEMIGAETGLVVKNPVPVVLVVLDEFNLTALVDATGHIDRVRFPHFAALAADSWWFPNAVAAAGSTERAVPAILTGRQPQPDVPLTPTAADYPHNLFTMVGEHYRLKIFETLTSLCPESLCREGGGVDSRPPLAALLTDTAVIYTHLITPPRLATRLPSLDAQWMGFGKIFLEGGEDVSEESKEEIPPQPPVKGAQDRDAQLEYILTQITESPVPVLHFLHVLLPHVPYEYLATGHQYFPSDGRPFPSGILDEKEGWVGEAPLLLTAYHRYLHQIGFLDRFLGRLRETLKTARLYDSALVILTADHGVSFQPGRSRRGVRKGDARDILKIPMFVKLPGQREGRISERLVSSLDILPTIADVLKIEAPWEMDGHSMLSPAVPGRTEITIPGVGKFQAEALEGYSRLDWQVAHFGMRSLLDHLVPKGPYSFLIGHQPADLDVGPSSALRVHSDDLTYIEQVNLESGFLAALLKGHLSGTRDRSLPLAIALNGRIWATTTTSEWEGEPNYFSVLLPPAAFRETGNGVKVYRIEEPGGRLLPVRDWDEGRPAVKLHNGRSGRRTLIFSDHREIPVSNDRGLVRGNLDAVSFMFGNRLVFSGWGADLAEKRPVAEVLIFAGEQLIARVEPGFNRQDVVNAHKLQGLLHSGFHAIVPVGMLESSREEIQVILVSQGNRALRLFLSNEQKDVIRAAVEKSPTIISDLTSKSIKQARD